MHDGSEPDIIDVVTSKRDKKRKHEVRIAAKRQREERNRFQTLIDDVVSVIKELHDAATDTAVDPDRFVLLLETRLKQGGRFSGLRDPSIAIVGIGLGDEQVERAGAIALSLRAKAAELEGTSASLAVPESSSTKAAMLWWASSFYLHAKRPLDADEAASEAFDLVVTAETTPKQLGEQGSSTRGSTQWSGSTRQAAVALAQLRLGAGRQLRAARLALDLCEADPFDAESMRLLGESATEMASRQTDPSAMSQSCPCGTGIPWSDCCKQGEAEILERILDRSKLRELHRCFERWASGEEKVAAWIATEISKWPQGPAADDGHRRAGIEVSADTGSPSSAPTEPPRHVVVEAAPLGSLGSLGQLAEMALETVWQRGPEVDYPDGEPTFAERIARYSEDPNRDSLIRRFADDPSTPAPLAELARSWSQSAECGLWQVEDPSDNPGLWLTDIVTGARRWVLVAPSQRVGLPRWTVLAGTIVADRGVWRSGAALARFHPTEADRAVEMVRAATENVAVHMARELGVPGSVSDTPRQPRLIDPPPHSILAALDEPYEPEAASMHHTVSALVLPELIGDASRSRKNPPKRNNSDGEWMQLLNAVAPIDDPAGLRQALGHRPDFDEGDAREGFVQLIWHGRELTPAEEEATLASARQAMANRGIDPSALETSPGPRRWIRGTVTISEGHLRVEVNSAERLAALTRILGRVGVADLAITRRFEPDLDGASSGANGVGRLHTPGSAKAERAWLNCWLDENLAALGGASPRGSVGDPAGAVRLERLVRDFEHDAGLAEAAGNPAMDTVALRDALVDIDMRSLWATTFAHQRTTVDGTSTGATNVSADL